MTKKAVGFAEGLASMRGLETNRAKTSKASQARAEETARASTSRIKPKGTGTREGRVGMTIWVEEEVRDEIAKLGITEKKTQATLMVEAINLLFQQYDKSPIAK